MYQSAMYQATMSDQQAERLRDARKKAGFESASDAARELGWQTSTYIHHENGTRSFTVDAAKRYARAYRVNAAWLLDLDGTARRGSGIVEFSNDNTVEVTGSVAAGVFHESSEWHPSERFRMAFGRSPFPTARRWGLRVDGFSMDVLFAPGTVLDCVSIFDVGIEPQNGDLVIVERVNGAGDHELTVKEFRTDDDGRFWLVPRSTKPEYQTPIEIGAPDRDFDGDDRVQVIAFVIGAYQSYASRLKRAAA